ncbi:hypothetical protein H8E77_31095 [bacterium]|nr:hypothetical protein [bacterium]
MLVLNIAYIACLALVTIDTIARRISTPQGKVGVLRGDFKLDALVQM